jgi:hypothetical protein
MDIMTAPPPVAPFNPKWPGGFVQMLWALRIEESNIPHFLRKEVRCFRGCRHRLGETACRQAISIARRIEI